MKREIYNELIKWKDDNYRKPLIIFGARQVGKTYIVNKFGNNEFKSFVKINCDKDKRIRDIFQNGYDIKKIITNLEIITGCKIIQKETLLFFDEVQEIPEIISSLKYFYEDAPEYHVIVAGSLLGLSMHEGYSFPVGKVDEITMYPMSFPEFICAKHGEKAYDLLVHSGFGEIEALSTLYKDALKDYYFTGGMPEVVKGYIEGREYSDLRNIQKNILADYSIDISKHADNEILGRIHQVWSSIPQQLVKSNKKFIYGDVQKGARAKNFELAIEWLKDAGIVYKISRVRKIGIPLKFYEDFSAFKLFLLDHGLMGAMVDAPISQILIGDNIFEEYKGAFTEQYVMEQIRCYSKGDIYYYDSESSKLELDFLLQREDKLIPIEVKANENLRSKSLRQFYNDNEDSLPVRLSMSGYRKEDWLTNIPLYATNKLFEID